MIRINNQQRREQTRAAILEAATRSFASDGYDLTGVAEICESANVSKGAFYYHFESKEAVFMELASVWLKSLENTLEEVVTQKGNVVDGLIAMAGMMKPVFEDNRQLMGLFNELWTHARRNERVREATLAPYRRYRDIFSDLIRRGVDEGSFRKVDPDTAGQLLLSLSSGLFLQASLDPDGEDWALKLQESIIILLEGLKRRN